MYNKCKRWFKNRHSTTTSSAIYDSLRGAGKELVTNTAAAEATDATKLTSFDSDGFSLGTSSSNTVNDASNSIIVAFGWKAGGVPTADNKRRVDDSSTEIALTGVTNTSRASATSTNYGSTGGTNNISAVRQSVNTAGGFSITKYVGGTGSADNNYIPHGLGATPEFIMIKRYTGSAQHWAVWHKNLANTAQGYLWLDHNGTESTSASYWSADDHDSKTISIGDIEVTGYDGSFICYAWKGVSGVSAFGTSTGGITESQLDSGTTVGTHGYCGFLPRMIIIKVTTGENWHQYSSFQSGGTTWANYLFPNTDDGEQVSTGREVHVKSDGFYIDAHSAIGGTGSVKMIWAAFA